MTRTIKNLGQAARHRLLVRVLCRKCDKVAKFTATDLAAVLGHGRTFQSIVFRCRDCNSKDCEVTPFEDVLNSADKKRVIWRPVRE